jgi:hypothetical protein
MYAFHSTMLSVLGFYNVDSATAQSYGKQGYVNIGASYPIVVVMSWAIVLLGYIIVQNLIIGIVTDAFEKAKTAADNSQRLHVSFFKAIKGHFAFYRWFYGTWIYQLLHFMFGKCISKGTRQDRVPRELGKIERLDDDNFNIDKDGNEYVTTRSFPDLSWKALRTQFFSKDEVWNEEESSVCGGQCSLQWILQKGSHVFAFVAQLSFALTVIVYVVALQELSLEGVTRENVYQMMQATAFLCGMFVLLFWICELAQPPQRQGVSLPKDSERFLLARSEELSTLTTHLMVSWDQWGEPIGDLDFVFNDKLSAEDLLNLFDKFSVGCG